MYKTLFYTNLLVFICASCSDNSEQRSINEDKQAFKSSRSLSIEEIAKRYVEANLSIPATEDYDMQIFKAKLNEDDSQDAIITVNRLKYAVNNAVSSEKTAKLAEIGLMGNYNYLFVYDGALKQVISQLAIPSSPYAKLKVNFEKITTEQYNDVLVDYRVLNASFRDFFTMTNGVLSRFFQWKNYDGVGGGKVEAYQFEYKQGTLSQQKDILIIKASFTQPKELDDIYTFEPKLICSNELIYRFFYHPETKKYMTRKE